MQKLWCVIKHLEYMPDDNSLTKINSFLMQKSEDITKQNHEYLHREVVTDGKVIYSR